LAKIPITTHWLPQLLGNNQKQSFVVALPQVPEQVQLLSLPFLPKNPMKMSLKVDIRSKKLQLVLKCKKKITKTSNKDLILKPNEWQPFFLSR
jgi:hypothetical protein